jgi:ABC-type transport system substrate-binding protein
MASGLFASAGARTTVNAASSSLPILRLDYGGPGEQPLDGFSGMGPMLLLVNAELVRILPNGKVAPDLATWTVSRNRLVYTFTIRAGARFSNGHRVTARDAEFSIKRFLTIGWTPLVYTELIPGATAFVAGKTTALPGVKILSDRTLQITITRPAAYFLPALAAFSFVFDPAVVAGKALDTTCAANQGAGPFMFVCADGGSNLHSFYSGTRPMYTLVPNPLYYGHRPRIRLELPSLVNGADFPGYEAFLKRYLAGTLDTLIFTPLPPPNVLSQWKGKSGEYIEFPSSSIVYLIPNVHEAPFDNVHCRLALAYAIDRETLANNVDLGSGRATYAIVPRGMLGYYSGSDNPHYDPARARAELARCPGRAILIPYKYPIGLPGSDAESKAIVNMLSAVGMNIKATPLSNLDESRVAGNPLDLTGTLLTGGNWNELYPDPHNYCSLLLRSDASWNHGGWSNATYDRLVDRADVTLNPAKRARLYIQAQHLALTQGAIISLHGDKNAAVIRPYVHGMVGTEALWWLVPKNYDWSNVSVDKH